MNFHDFQLNTFLLKAVDDLNFKIPTEIQVETIPFLLENNTDFIGQAQTGTGKTAAYTLPLLQKIDLSNATTPQALILTPTRELATQVHNDIKKMATYTQIKVNVFFGGTGYEKQITHLKKHKPHVVVGTPGRILDLINKNYLKLEKASHAILDEADEMLNMGFFEDVQKILKLFQDDKKIWMFSATMPRPILNLIKNEFQNPKIIKITKKNLSNENIEQHYYIIKKKYYREALNRIIDSIPSIYGIIFCRTRIETRELSESLLSQGYKVETLHGDIEQSQREQAMLRFKNHKVNLLICTDLASRGLDINNLTHVINYGLPQDMESYVHRIGRTGRAGTKGIALTILERKSCFWIKNAERSLGVTLIKKVLPSIDILKSNLVQNELSNIQPLLSNLLDKGEHFKLDKTFALFRDCLGDLSKDDLLKISFTWKFHKTIKKYDDLKQLEDDLPLKKSYEKRKRTNKGHTRFFVNIGKDDGIKFHSLLQNLSRQTGVRQDKIQNIELKNKFSFIEVPSQYSTKFINNKSITINQRRIRFEEAR